MRHHVSPTSGQRAEQPASCSAGTLINTAAIEVIVFPYVVDLCYLHMLITVCGLDQLSVLQESHINRINDLTSYGFSLTSSYVTKLLK